MAVALDCTADLTTVDPASYYSSNVFYLTVRTSTNEGGGAKGNEACVKVTGVTGLTPKFRVTNPGAWDQSASGEYETGFFSEDGGSTWTPGIAPVYGAGYIEFEPQGAFSSDTVWFSRDRREGPAQILAWINGLAAAHPTFIVDVADGVDFVADTYSQQTDELTNNHTADLHAFAVRDGLSSRKKMILMAGTHACEDNSITVLRYAVDWLCGSSTEARNLRRTFDVIVIPVMNGIGKVAGHYRSQYQLQGSWNDLNRHFEDGDQKGTFETVVLNRAILDAECADNNVSVNLDYHGKYFGSAMGYYQTSDSLWDDYGSALANRGVDTGSEGMTNNNTTTTWGINAKHASLSTTLEVNRCKLKTDSALQALGEKSLLAVYDLLHAGLFPGVTEVTDDEGPASYGSPFGRGSG